MVIETISDDAYILTQGFQQSYFYILSTDEPEDQTFEVSIYPNPAKDITTIEILSDEELPNLQMTLFDIIGNKILVETIKQPQYREQIQLTQFATDMFFLRITNLNSKTTMTFKILKVKF